MSTTTDEYAITDRRTATVERGTARHEWVVTEFNHGQTVLLTCQMPGAHFQAHFTAEGWREFQALVA